MTAEPIASGERDLRHRGWRLLAHTLNLRRGLLGLAVLSSVIWTGARLVIPLLAAAAIDKGIIPNDSEVILRYTVLILLVGLFQVFGIGLRRYSAFRLGYRVETDLRDQLFAHLQRLHFAFHDEAQTGQLISRANTDMLQITQMLTLVPLTMSSVLILVGVTIVMMLSSVTLALLALGTLPILTTSRCASRTGWARRRSHSNRSSASSRVSSRRVSPVFES